MLIKLWQHLSLRRKKQSALLLSLMIVTSGLEVFSLGAVIPFLGVLTNPEYIYQHALTQSVIEMLNVTTPKQLILPFTTLFIMAALLSGFSRLLLLYAMTKVLYLIAADIGVDIYRKTLYQKYSVHTGRNSSEIINGMITKTNAVISGVLNSVMVLVSSFILFLGIMSALLVIDPKAALSIFVGLGFLYAGVIYFTHNTLKKNSVIVATKSNLLVKYLQEGLGGIRDVLIDGSQEFYCKKYGDSDLILRKASGLNQFISGSPRFIMESLGMIVIAVIAYIMTQDGSIAAAAVPVLGAIALGAQKILPAIQQSYSAYANMKGSRSSLHDVIELLDQKIPLSTFQSSIATLGFKESIKLEEVFFSYAADKKFVLKDFSLEIPKGAHVGFIGETGSGKSTTVDIIMGLLSPTHGSILVDGVKISDGNTKAWQSHISHVPQNIFLSDGTIEENIAFGVPMEFIDHKRVRLASEQAQISEMVDSLELGYDTYIGENGVRLSGGQRQRLGIARALYKRSDVLVFDEATSSLDSATESEVMKSIANLDGDLTVLIIAHRLTTLKKCDFIVEIKKNNSMSLLKYSDIHM